MTDTISAAVGGLSASERAIAGLVLAGVISLTARALRQLTPSGALAATLLGAVTAWAGWAWAATLVVYFVASAALTAIGRARKRRRTGGMHQKVGARDATQVLANGGVYSAAAVATVVFALPALRPAALSALAAAAADTWSTELGILIGGAPRMLLSRTIVRVGESGGVTVAGLVGGAAGAAMIAAVGFAAGVSIRSAFVVAVAGVAGAVIDSLVGELLQEKLWCDRCGEPTERRVHACGSVTRHATGVTGVNNDFVNLIATLSGFSAGLLIYLLVPIAR